MRLDLENTKFEASVYAPTYIYEPLKWWQYWLNKVGFNFEREKRGHWLYKIDTDTYICSYETYAKIHENLNVNRAMGN